MIRNPRLFRVIDKNMLRRIPPSKTKIHATHERDRLVDHAQLLVLRTINTKTATISSDTRFKGYGCEEEREEKRAESTHMRPIKRPGLEMRRRALHHNIRM